MFFCLNNSLQVFKLFCIYVYIYNIHDILAIQIRETQFDIKPTFYAL